MTEATQTEFHCPKEGAAMTPMGRRMGAWRCPECHAVFLDTEAMRRGRAGQPPMWAPFVMSIVMSVLMTMVVRRLKRRAKGSKKA